MARDLPHLPLRPWSEPLARRPRGGGGGSSKRDDRVQHGGKLLAQATSVAQALVDRKRKAQGVDPKLVFRLRLNPEYGSLPEDQIARFGLTVLALEPGNIVVVFPDSESLDELSRRLRSYSGVGDARFKYAEVDAIEAIERLGPADRIGRRLREEPVENGVTVGLDVELWHSGSRDECRKWIGQLAQRVESTGGRVSDSFVGSSLCLARVQANQQTVDALLADDLDFIKEIERPPQPSLELLDVLRFDINEAEVVAPSEADEVVGILVIDSGIVGHPLLAPSLGDAQSFVKDSDGQELDHTDRVHGHGTAVSGIALYGDIGHCIESRQFKAGAQLFSARVTDEQCRYDEFDLIERQLESAVEYFLSNYKQIRVINISLGNSDSVLTEDGKQFRFAAAIDEIAYRYRDREILFVVSAGNYSAPGLTGEQMLQAYPDYLLNDPDARLLDPATSAIAITVGSLSNGAARRLRGETEARVDRLIGGTAGNPSPFTRSGPGIGGAIKPEVVEYGGDVRFEGGEAQRGAAQWAGVPSTSHEFAEGRVFRMVAGTSFAAPRVAHLACSIFRQFPDASSNLVRALIADSARVPSTRPTSLADRKEWEEEVLRLYGYGQPSLSRACWSSEHEALLVSDGVIELDQFQLFQLPSLPKDFLSATGEGQIAVTLAFDPPTRHTRSDSYMGVAMEAHLFRNIEIERVADLLRAELAEERASRGSAKRDAISDWGSEVKVDLKPGVNRRKAGTLQRGACRISRSNWKYDGAGLVLAVTCLRRWAPESITSQRYGVVVSISHTNSEVRVYEHLRQQIEQRAQFVERVRTR